MTSEFNFTFGNQPSRVVIQNEIPSIQKITDSPALIVCDSNTECFARKILSAKKSLESRKTHILILDGKEESKTWDSVQKILIAAQEAHLGRDGVFIGVGGGLVSDLCAFSASIYLRGLRLFLVSTTLLGMIDASLGGKTGIHLCGFKNMAGTFYPANKVVLPLSALNSLPEKEWKSGMAELIKTAILDSKEFFEKVKSLISLEKNGRNNKISYNSS